MVHSVKSRIWKKIQGIKDPVPGNKRQVKWIRNRRWTEDKPYIDTEGSRRFAERKDTFISLSL